MNMSFPVRWAVGAVVMAVVVTFAFSGLISLWATSELRDQAARGLAAQVELVGRDLANRLESRLEEVAAAAQIEAALDLRDDPVRLRGWLDARKAAMPGVVWLGITDADGTIRAAAGGVLEGVSVASRDWFLRGREGPAVLDRHAAVLLEPFIEKRSNEPTRLMDFVAPIRGKDGTVIGVLAAHLRWEQVRAEIDIIAAGLRTEPGVEVSLRDASGSTAVEFMSPGQMIGAVTVEAPVIGGAEVSRLGWQLAVRLPGAALEAQANRLTTRVAWLAGAVGFAAVLIAAIAARSAARSLADSQAAFDAVGHLVPGIVFGAVREGDRLRMTHYTTPIGRQMAPDGDTSQVLALIHPDDRPRLLEAFGRAEAEVSDAPVEVEVRSRMTADPNDWRDYADAEVPGAPEKWLHVALRGRRSAGGKITVEGVALEVTNIKRTAALEAENRRLAELRAKDADRMAQNKAEVLAVMAHEIRTPLTGVLGFSELLVGADLPGEARQHAEIVHATGSMLLSVVNDILDLAKIEAGKVSLEQVPFQPRSVAEQAVALAGATTARKGLRLTLHVAPDVPEWLQGDPMRIRQVLGNLLGNAVKFTERGSVRVRMSAVGGVAPMLRVDVADTGIGVPPEAMGRLFTMFGQAEQATARRFGGTGLGLALCRRLVEAMGGQIGAVSEPGLGSTFCFEVPLQAATPSAAAVGGRPDEKMVRPMHLLVVDDVATNRQLLRIMLTTMGHTVTLAESGIEALDALNHERFDAVLMDVNMPGMDGLEATRRIRALPDARARLPILALTAGATRADADEALAAGMTAHVPKPVSRANLRAALEQTAAVVA